MSRVLVTGANGFVGTLLCQVLVKHGYEVRAAFRRTCSHSVPVQEQVVIGDIDSATQWEEALQDVDYVIHLAARVHIMKEVTVNPLAAFCEVNCEGTMRLAEQSAGLGVKRLVYVSSIKVNGDKTNGIPFRAIDLPNPQDPYGVSKAEAEVQLREVSTHTNMEVVIIRPPMVYGLGVRGNFLKLMKLVGSGIPLPLNLVCNSRSMVSLNNLTDLLVCCLNHPRAVNETFLVSDGVEWSTPELIRSIAYYMGAPVRLFPVSLSLLKQVGRITGQFEAVNRLCGSLEVDISKTRELLAWSPPQSSARGIKEAVDWYLEQKNA